MMTSDTMMTGSGACDSVADDDKSYADCGVSQRDETRCTVKHRKKRMLEGSR